jgi:hypothetical protein
MEKNINSVAAPVILLAGAGSVLEGEAMRLSVSQMDRVTASSGYCKFGYLQKIEDYKRSRFAVAGCIGGNSLVAESEAW